MKQLAERIGLYRVAALLIAGALALEIVRVGVVSGSAPGQIACTFGEVLFISLGAMVFLVARRKGATPEDPRESGDG